MGNSLLFHLSFGTTLNLILEFDENSRPPFEHIHHFTNDRMMKSKYYVKDVEAPNQGYLMQALNLICSYCNRLIEKPSL